MQSMSRRQFLANTAVAGGLALIPSCGRETASPLALAQAGIEEGAIASLRSTIHGRVVVHGDAEYDVARRVGSFNPLTDKYPTLIVRCSNTADVMRAVEFARSHDLEIAVRSGGNDVLGQSVCERGMVVDLSGMKAMTIDQKRKVGTFGSGLRSGEVNDATQRHGLAVPLGCHPGIGLGGLTLGGGLGWLVGKHGATCDNLISAEVVTADAETLPASADENPNLLWGLRGGGGNFGIATSLTYRLHSVGRVLGGYIAYRGEQTSEFLRFYRDFMAGAPDELVVELKLLALDGPTIVALVCYSGDDLVAGERVLQPLRSFGPPLADSIAGVEYARLTDTPGVSFGLRTLGVLGTLRTLAGWVAGEPAHNHWRGSSARPLSDAAIETLSQCVDRAPRGWSIGIGHYLHGAVCRAAPATSSLPRDCGGYSYFFHASWFDPRQAAASMRWVDRSWDLMKPHASQATQINYLSSGSEQAVATAYHDNYPRLVDLKTQFDPENVFHLNRNVRPKVGHPAPPPSARSG